MRCRLMLGFEGAGDWKKARKWLFGANRMKIRKTEMERPKIQTVYCVSVGRLRYSYSCDSHVGRLELLIPVRIIPEY